MSTSSARRIAGRKPRNRDPDPIRVVRCAVAVIIGLLVLAWLTGCNSDRAAAEEYVTITAAEVQHATAALETARADVTRAVDDLQKNPSEMRAAALANAQDRLASARAALADAQGRAADATEALRRANTPGPLDWLLDLGVLAVGAVLPAGGAALAAIRARRWKQAAIHAVSLADDLKNAARSRVSVEPALARAAHHIRTLRPAFAHEVKRARKIVKKRSQEYLQQEINKYNDEFADLDRESFPPRAAVADPADPADPASTATTVRRYRRADANHATTDHAQGPNA